MSTSRFSLDGKVAVITGATRGIGRAIAFTFAEQGARIVVVSRKQDAVDATVAAIVAAGGKAVGIASNVAKEGEPARIAAFATEQFGGLDILVNNAAANPAFGPVEQTSGETFDKIIGVNLKAPFELAKQCLPSMTARGGGAVLNISSIGGVSPEPGLGIYSVSKTAIISLTQVMAKEWGKHNVRANAICPGLIKTDFASALWGDPKILAHTLRKQAIGRLGEPEDIAGLALFLCSGAAAFCTGGVYMADGGYTI
jgi:NAD(P)-dependent dehydrogenase (short-subunit alcohol dehydrogenase family)